MHISPVSTAHCVLQLPEGLQRKAAVVLWMNIKQLNNGSILSLDTSRAYHDHGMCWKHRTETGEKGPFSPAAAGCLYRSMAVFNKGVDDCYWSAVLVDLSSCHTRTRAHTWHWQQQQQQQSIGKLGQFVAGFRKRPRDTQTQQLMSFLKKKCTHNASAAAAGIT